MARILVIAFLAGVSGLSFSPAYAQSDELTKQAIQRSQEYFFRTQGVQCGELWSFGFLIGNPPGLVQPFQPPPPTQFNQSANYLQATGIGWTLQPAQPGNVSVPDRMNGVLWRGTVIWKAQAHRLYDATGALTGERGWTPWRGEGETVLSSTLEYRNGQWITLSSQMNVKYFAAIQPFKPDCAAIQQALANPPPSLRETRQQELEQLRQRELQMQQEQALRRQQSEWQRQETYRRQQEMMQQRKQQEWEAIRRLQQGAPQ